MFKKAFEQSSLGKTVFFIKKLLKQMKIMCCYLKHVKHAIEKYIICCAATKNTKKSLKNIFSNEV